MKAKKRKPAKKRAAKKTAAKRPAKIGALSKKIASLTMQKNKLQKKYELTQKMKSLKNQLKKVK